MTFQSHAAKCRETRYEMAREETHVHCAIGRVGVKGRRWVVSSGEIREMGAHCRFAFALLNNADGRAAVGIGRRLAVNRSAASKKGNAPRKGVTGTGREGELLQGWGGGGD